MSSQNILELRDICKGFPGVQALDHVSFNIQRGDVHALVGENGAGKSTLIKIISGVYSIDSGTIIYDGQPLVSDAPSHSIDIGISTVHQELKMVETLDVAENIFLGHPLLKKGVAGTTINKKQQHFEAQELLNSMGVAIDSHEILSNLSVAKKQIVEICKALNRNAKLIIMDEPSATLTHAEMDILFSVIRRLKSNNITVIYISHRLEEIFELADRVTILRDGKSIISGDISEFDKDKLIRHMVGRQITNLYPHKSCVKAEKVLEISHLSRQGVLHDINFTLYAGEILGITGLVGSGRSELLRAVFGADPIDSGKILVNNVALRKRHRITDAIKLGIGLVPEERKVEGIIPEFAVSKNLTVVGISKIKKHSFLNARLETEASDEYIKLLRIATPNGNTEIQYLSGGNQQKVVLAKWLFNESDILILDEPTRGIDVGAKQEIYRILTDLANQRKAVLIVSSELPEVLGISNRILVMHDGKITGEFDGSGDSELTQEMLMHAATL